MRDSKRHRCKEQTLDSVGKGWVRGCEEGQIGRTQRIFRAIDNTLCGAIMMDMCHYKVQTHKIYSIKSEL